MWCCVCCSGGQLGCRWWESGLRSCVPVGHLPSFPASKKREEQQGSTCPIAPTHLFLPPTSALSILQDGSAVAMTETVRGTFRVDLGNLATLERVRCQDGWGGVGALCGAPVERCIRGRAAPLSPHARVYSSPTTPRLVPASGALRWRCHPGRPHYCPPTADAQRRPDQPGVYGGWVWSDWVGVVGAVRLISLGGKQGGRPGRQAGR